MIVEMTVKLHIESDIFPDDGQVQDVREMLMDDYPEIKEIDIIEVARGEP